MRYVSAKIDYQSRMEEKWRNDTVYQMYMAEGIKAISDNTSRVVGGVVLKYNLLDVLSGDAFKVDTRTKEDIIDNISNKLDELGKGDTDGCI